MKRFTRKASKRAKASKQPAAKRAKGRVRISPALQAYLDKTDAYRAGREPLGLMRGAPARLTREVRGLRRAQLRKRPAKGKWSIQEIVGHLMDTEVVYAYRWHMAYSESGSPIQGYDQETWTREEDYRHSKWSVKEMLEHIANLRRSTMYYLDRIPRAEAKRRHGIHSERGKETMHRTQELIAGHDINHLEQIKAIKKKYGW